MDAATLGVAIIDDAREARTRAHATAAAAHATTMGSAIRDFPTASQ
jgi:hypothetical protein